MLKFAMRASTLATFDDVRMLPETVSPGCTTVELMSSRTISGGAFGASCGGVTGAGDGVLVGAGVTVAVAAGAAAGVAVSAGDVIGRIGGVGDAAGVPEAAVATAPAAARFAAGDAGGGATTAEALAAGEADDWSCAVCGAHAARANAAAAHAP